MSESPNFISESYYYTYREEEILMLTIIAEFAPSLGRVWEVYTDPRQLEQIWGRPPATVVDHSLELGGRVT